MKSEHEINLLPTLWSEQDKRTSEGWLSCLHRALLVGTWHRQKAGEHRALSAPEQASFLSFSGSNTDEYSPPRWESASQFGWPFGGSETLRPGICLLLVLWEISASVPKVECSPVNSIKVYTFVCVCCTELRLAICHLFWLNSYLLAGRWWLEAGLRIAGKNPVFFLLWNHVLLSELQV